MNKMLFKIFNSNLRRTARNRRERRYWTFISCATKLLERGPTMPSAGYWKRGFEVPILWTGRMRSDLLFSSTRFRE